MLLAGARRARRVAASSAVGVRAESDEQLDGSPGGDGRRDGGGASSSTTWAFVPPMPNELTPARRGPSARPLARAACSRRRGSLARVDRRVRLLEVQAGRDLPVLQGQHGLDQPGDAGGGVEVADVGLHRADGADQRLGPPPSPNAWRRAGSRSGRRARCRCRGPRRSRSSRVARPPSASARAITSACPSTLGAVKPTFCEPSLLTAVPRITAWIVSPSASASCEPLQDHDPDAVAADRAPRLGVEGAAVAVGREDAVLPGRGSRPSAGRRSRRRRRAPCRTRRQQALAGEVDGHQRGRAGGLDGRRSARAGSSL